MLHDEKVGKADSLSMWPWQVWGATFLHHVDGGGEIKLGCRQQWGGGWAQSDERQTHSCLWTAPGSCLLIVNSRLLLKLANIGFIIWGEGSLITSNFVTPALLDSARWLRLQ